MYFHHNTSPHVAGEGWSTGGFGYTTRLYLDIDLALFCCLRLGCGTAPLCWLHKNLGAVNTDIWKFYRRTQSMARKSGWSRTFRKDSKLQQYFLDQVVPTGKTLGTGSYGSVLEVSGEF